MKLLIRAATSQGKRLLLLFLAFFFMILSSYASNFEMLAIGSVTRGGIVPAAAESVEDRNPLNSLLASVSGSALWMRDLRLLAIVLVAIAGIKGVSLFGAHYTRQLVMIRVSRDLRQQYFEHIQKLSLDFYAKYNVGSLSTRVSDDARNVAEAVYAMIVTYIQTPVAVISGLVFCFMLSFKLSLMIFIGFPIVLGPVLYFAKKIKKIARRLLANSEAYSATLLDSLLGIQTIKLFAMEPFSIAKFRSHNEQKARLEEKSARYGFASRPVLHMLSTLMLAFIILYGLYVAKMNISDILVFCGLVYLMYEPIKRLSDENMKIQNGAAAAERIYQVLALQPKIADAENAQEIVSFQKNVEFDDVWFRYNDQWVLQGLNFTIEKGQVVALVGSTGAGKSTVAHLLPRLWEPERGEIRIDGKPLEAYTQRSLRELIAFVPQKPFLFLDSVAENIAFGRSFTREEVVEAATRAYAHDFITALPQGYDTPLKEGGKNLSGGQQQRLAIARALVKKAPILVMDEATSSLDAVSEQHIKQAICDLRGEITQILIAHRLSTIEHADKILVIDQGALIASGTKEELLETCPTFRIMWETMMGRGAVALPH
ncbi:MAG: ABC transporter ATP-binding protein [Verrucomicrobia bacterium]|nr:ABC transporter ATP-binding protein [Verrucomicrobiota bacterium]